MAIEIPPVNPGDLITAGKFNEIIQALVDLDRRIGTTPAPTPTRPRIDAFDPPTEVREGTNLRIIGAGFATPSSLNQVTFGGTPATAILPGSNDRELRVGVPALSGLPRDVTVEVSNAGGQATRGIRVLDIEELPFGDIDVTNATETGVDVLVGSRVTWVFRIDAGEVGMPETYELEARFANVVGATAAAWLSELQWVGATNSRVTVDPATPVTVGVSVRVPSGAATADLSLKVTSVRNPSGARGESGAVRVEVGQPQEVGDPSITIRLGTLPPEARVADIDGRTGLEVQRGTFASITALVSMLLAGDYEYEVRIPDATGVWAVRNQDPTESTEAAGGSADVEFSLQLTSSGPGPSERKTLEISVEGTPTGQSRTIRNVLRLPLRGF